MREYVYFAATHMSSIAKPSGVLVYESWDFCICYTCVLIPAIHVSSYLLYTCPHTFYIRVRIPALHATIYVSSYLLYMSKRGLRSAVLPRMYVCRYMYAYLYIYAYIYIIYTHTYIYVCLYTYILCIYMHTCYTCVRSLRSAPLPRATLTQAAGPKPATRHIYVCVYICIYLYIYVYIYIYTCIHIYIYTYIHTYI
jgi:hypothetical protein